MTCKSHVDSCVGGGGKSTPSRIILATFYMLELRNGVGYKVGLVTATLNMFSRMGRQPPSLPLISRCNF